MRHLLEETRTLFLGRNPWKRAFDAPPDGFAEVMELDVDVVRPVAFAETLTLLQIPDFDRHALVHSYVHNTRWILLDRGPNNSFAITRTHKV